MSQYAAQEVGKDVLHGIITDALPPSLYVASKLGKPMSKFHRLLLDPIISDTVLISDAFPLETIVENATWWNDSWEWEFRSFWRKTGGRQITCHTRSNWDIDANGYPIFVNVDAARAIGPEMHKLAISHDPSTRILETLWLQQATPRSGKYAAAVCPWLFFSWCVVI